MGQAETTERHLLRSLHTYLKKEGQMRKNNNLLRFHSSCKHLTKMYVYYWSLHKFFGLLVHPVCQSLFGLLLSAQLKYSWIVSGKHHTDSLRFALNDWTGATPPPGGKQYLIILNVFVYFASCRNIQKQTNNE